MVVTSNTPICCLFASVIYALRHSFYIARVGDLGKGLAKIFGGQLPRDVAGHRMQREIGLT
ncbi:hypothetical protein JF732_08185 [Mycobacterium intracellulare]|uniref:Uncharacterized protein n=1 Tax=Mycobacterium intracellulare TaxID=1767 RepID=A0AAE4R8V8_MYCIT|nr:hypothetical protein [Mycobacterium intracellulare]MCA2318236.1 hypothetical protein [Mycobacterium intracellulare]MCA2340522.1 hypothetical protein [Mycobacterium intracellulare]MDV6974844.1 hypothetical protein [Mycobacterium intracellulare]MDV6981033.1 hypothetical protein [Mycobacterium intracellulare]MDV7011431.1 hypothetical protein [Mycobacterium intracellulare]